MVGVLIFGLVLGIVVENEKNIIDDDVRCSSIGFCIGEHVVSNTRYTEQFGVAAGRVADIRAGGYTLLLKTNTGEYVFLDDANAMYQPSVNMDVSIEVVDLEQVWVD